MGSGTYSRLSWVRGHATWQEQVTHLLPVRRRLDDRHAGRLLRRFVPGDQRVDLRCRFPWPKPPERLALPLEAADLVASPPSDPGRGVRGVEQPSCTGGALNGCPRDRLQSERCDDVVFDPHRVGDDVV